MEKEELMKSKEYWTTKIQIALYEAIENYLSKNKLTRAQLAEQLGVTRGYITQVLNGDFDHKISKMVELAIACNIAPVFSFEPLDKHVARKTKRTRIIKAANSDSKKKLVAKPLVRKRA